jgi:hypothetical protein
MQPEARTRLCAAAVLAACLGSGCAGLGGQHPPAPAPVVSPQATSATVIAGYLQLLQKLATGQPAEQRGVVTTAKHECGPARTPTHQLKRALTLRHPGATATRLANCLMLSKKH